MGEPIVLDRMRQVGIVPHVQPFSAHRNTIGLDHQGAYPGDPRTEERLSAMREGRTGWEGVLLIFAVIPE